MTTQHTIRAITGDLAVIEARWPEYLAARDLLAPSPIRASRTDGTRTGRGGHSDPVLSHILNTIGGPDDDTTPDPDPDEATTAIEATRTQVRWIRDLIERDIASTRRRPPTDQERLEHERDMRKGQCELDGDNGERCPNQAERNGQCWTHIKRAQRANLTGILDVSTPHLVDTATFTHRAPAIATVWCHTCRTDHHVPAGQDAETWLDAHRTTCTG